jgi:hypothetical protein
MPIFGWLVCTVMLAGLPACHTFGLNLAVTVIFPPPPPQLATQGGAVGRAVAVGTAVGIGAGVCELAMGLAGGTPPYEYGGIV